MFGSIGMPEIILILIVALLLFGPKKLPEIGKTIGRSIAEFKKASNDLKRSLEEEVDAASQELSAPAGKSAEKSADKIPENPKDPYTPDEPPAG